MPYTPLFMNVTFNYLFKLYSSCDFLKQNRKNSSFMSCRDFSHRCNFDPANLHAKNDAIICGQYLRLLRKFQHKSIKFWVLYLFLLFYHTNHTDEET